MLTKIPRDQYVDTLFDNTKTDPKENKIYWDVKPDLKQWCIAHNVSMAIEILMYSNDATGACYWCFDTILLDMDEQTFMLFKLTWY